ncbi:hypothetical protein D3081_09100, partial [Campylobacter coli]|nr:hypothetical protein [Campylobacter coli]
IYVKIVRQNKENFLFNEIDSIFSPNSVNEAKRLKIYEIPLLFDIGFNAEHKTNLTYNINY